MGRKARFRYLVSSLENANAKKLGFHTKVSSSSVQATNGRVGGGKAGRVNKRSASPSEHEEVPRMKRGKENSVSPVHVDRVVVEEEDGLLEHELGKDSFVNDMEDMTMLELPEYLDDGEFYDLVDNEV